MNRNLGERPDASSVLQGAINAGLDALARGLALELSPIRVNTVSPGLIDTPLWSKMEPQAKDAIVEWPTCFPRKRWATPPTLPTPSFT